MSRPQIINPEDWNKNKTQQPYERAVNALEHLIQNNFNDKSSVRFVEIGPVCLIDILKSKHIAPVSILHARNPLINCLAYGGEKPASEEESKKTLGNVEMIHGLLTIEDFYNESIELLFKKLSGSPNIIFGQHVFENSDSSSRSLPFGPYKPFEKASEILEIGGYIVVDNYGGRLNSVGKHDNWKFTKQMKYESSYMYSEGQGIHVFKKI